MATVEGLGLHDVSEIPDWIADIPYIGVWHTMRYTQEVLAKFKSCKVRSFRLCLYFPCLVAPPHTFIYP